MESSAANELAGANAAPRRTTSSTALPTKLLTASLFAVVLAAAAAHHLQLVEAPVWQQLRDNLQHIQDKLPTNLQQHLGAWHPLFNGIAQKFRHSSNRRLFTTDELSQYTGGKEPEDSQQIYAAILGEVFDVTSKPQFYGPGGGYACFAGTDGSKSFITGDFVGDVTDDVSSLEPEACLGLVGWLEFYHETYPHKGKLIGRFYDQSGKPTAELASVHKRAKEGQKLKANREKEEQKWPTCNTKWTQEEGEFDGVYAVQAVFASQQTKVINLNIVLNRSINSMSLCMYMNGQQTVACKAEQSRLAAA
eukprot:GHUV01017795.1.p1 GENE.GHUV01017795.1~~GHUV01017795.1.p1  ORF type:complete len:306 (+),score=81.49 GHUV01017795.1:228-1145(+)